MNTPAVPIIAVDGPSGSGKGTLSRQLAGILGFHFLDSGAIYRALGLKATLCGTPLDQLSALTSLALDLSLRFETRGVEEPEIWLGDHNVTQDIRTETCAAAASRVAAIPEVRAALLQTQRQFAQPPGLVADGRDMGSVVFPQATLKLFLIADPDERARRRQNQLKEQGISASLSDLLADLARRDARDASRSVAPLAPSADAIVLDSTGKDASAVLAEALSLTRRRIAAV